MEINIYNETEEKIDDILKIMYDTLAHGIDKLKVGDVIFNVIIVNNEYIKHLNKEYRGIDRETDVISFALEDDKTFNPIERVLGDIYISIDKAKSQSEEYKHSLKRELCFLAVHGMLHLLGYDHMTIEDEKIMFDMQEKILDEMNVKR